jgi:hypothetical protein
LKKAPQEMKNEYTNPAYSEIVTDLKKQLIEKRKELNVEDTNFPHLQQVIDVH